MKSCKLTFDNKTLMMCSQIIMLSYILIVLTGINCNLTCVGRQKVLLKLVDVFRTKAIVNSIRKMKIVSLFAKLLLLVQLTHVIFQLLYDAADLRVERKWGITSFLFIKLKEYFGEISLLLFNLSSGIWRQDVGMVIKLY